MELNNLGGYLNPENAASLSEFGKPFELSNCGGWLLSHEIPDCSHEDAMGCYPLFLCKKWSGIGDDIAQIKQKYVSLSFVTDPFGDFAPEKLAEKFDICFELKKTFHH